MRVLLNDIRPPLEAARDIVDVVDHMHREMPITVDSFTHIVSDTRGELQDVIAILEKFGIRVELVLTLEAMNDIYNARGVLRKSTCPGLDAVSTIASHLFKARF